MKAPVILVVSIALLPLQTTQAYCQPGNDPNLVIRRIIETGMIEGHDAKVIGGMGDAAAVILAKVLADRDLRQQDVVAAFGFWQMPSLVNDVSRWILIVSRGLHSCFSGTLTCQPPTRR